MIKDQGSELNLPSSKPGLLTEDKWAGGELPSHPGGRTYFSGGQWGREGLWSGKANLLLGAIAFILYISNFLKIRKVHAFFLKRE